MAPPKGPRRATTNLSTVTNASTSTPPARSTKSNKPSKIVTLRASKEFLSDLAGLSLEPAGSQKNAPASNASKPPPSTPSAASKGKARSESTPNVKAADTEDAPSPEKESQQPEDTTAKAGMKREADAMPSEDGKQKAKGPQRKRPKVGENGRLDGRTAAAKAAGFVAGAHKLGPKANQGAINEKLRALDRTSKPCRQWVKTGFKIKSFTGRVWEVPSWRSPQSRSFGTAVDGGSQDNSNSVSKDENSSNVGSDNSPAGPPEAASSPAVAAVPAAA